MLTQALKYIGHSAEGSFSVIRPPMITGELDTAGDDSTFSDDEVEIYHQEIMAGIIDQW